MDDKAAFFVGALIPMHRQEASEPKTVAGIECSAKFGGTKSDDGRVCRQEWRWFSEEKK